LASSFHIYSVSGVGTALMIRLWANNKSDMPNILDIEVISTPKPPEKLNGDAWSIVYYLQKVFFLVADGLGHGPEAAQASQKAVETFDSVSARSPAEYIEAIHTSLQGTRGAAVAVVEVDLIEQQVRFAGVGNINTVLVSSSKNQSMLSQPGIVGQQIRSLQELVYTWKEMANPLLIIHTDGMERRWDLDDYPGLAPMPLSLIAGVLLTKHMRGYDDIAVLVSRLRQP
jgi:serine phosphatase RsbU (regulator of sigma subunit)